MTSPPTSASPSPPGLDIVIVSFNTRDLLRACLRSLAAAPPHRPHVVVVVDNGSTDGTVDMLGAEFPDVRLVALDRNAGFAAANNAGIRATHYPLVLLLNSDTRVPAGAIDTLCQRLEATGAVAAGPRLRDAHGGPEVSWGRMLSPWSELAQATWVRLAASGRPLARRLIALRTSRERAVDWVSGACLLVRRPAAEAAGLFDERYFLYEEDVDFCAALRAAGGRVLFTPAADVVHERGRSPRPAGGPAAAAYDRSHLAFYAKHRPAWAPILRRWLRRRGRA